MAFKPSDPEPYSKAQRIANLEAQALRWEEDSTQSSPWPNRDEIEKVKKGGKGE